MSSAPEPDRSAGGKAGAATRRDAHLVGALSRRPWLRRGFSLLSALLAVVGVGMLAYPFATNLYQSRLQDRLEDEFESDDLREKYAAGSLGEGDALTRLRMPTIGVDVVVVEGTSASALRAGAGHYPATPLPGEAGNVAIAGHRTTYGRPFHSTDKIMPGDEIVLETPVGRHVYRALTPPSGARQFDVPDGAAGYVVDAHDWTPIVNTPDRGTLTLTSCHPKGSAKYRLIVKAELVESTEM